MEKLQTKFAVMQGELCQDYIERSDVIAGLLASMLCEEPAIMIGPPGTAKGELAKSFVDRFPEANFFQLLIAKTTTPEELFGPLKISQLEKDIYERNTDRYLPWAHIIFLDEVFRGSSAILNTLLTALMEREFDNNGRHPIPLKMCVGASNDLPDTAELAAFYDRWTVRFFVSPLRSRGSRMRLLNRERNGRSETTMSMAELNRAIEHRKAIKVSEVIKDRMLNVWEDLESQNFYPSDRRWHKSLAYLQAHAFLAGHDEVAPSDMTRLTDVLWETPQDIDKIRQTIANHADPLSTDLRRIVDAVTERVGRIPKPETGQREDIVMRGTEAQKTLTQAKRDLDDLAKRAMGVELGLINEARNRLKKMGKKVEKLLIQAVSAEEV